MSYDPEIHHRRSIRLKDYDYSNEGMYFITICCDKREDKFGDIINNKMIMNELGNIAQTQWQELTTRFSHITLGEFVVMPNHFHGILIIENVLNSDETTKITSISDVVGAYKSLVMHHVLKLFGDKPLGKIWQKNMYEHIIRNLTSYNKIENYIINNPQSWGEDTYNQEVNNSK